MKRYAYAVMALCLMLLPGCDDERIISAGSTNNGAADAAVPERLKCTYGKWQHFETEDDPAASPEEAAENVIRLSNTREPAELWPLFEEKFFTPLTSDATDRDMQTMATIQIDADSDGATGTMVTSRFEAKDRSLGWSETNTGYTFEHVDGFNGNTDGTFSMPADRTPWGFLRGLSAFDYHHEQLEDTDLRDNVAVETFEMDDRDAAVLAWWSDDEDGGVEGRVWVCIEQ